ncbi:MAG: hypothetical protein FJW90_12925 [Actinobacteria bacterium]|nr:hypothetical protein [Actinomycetota bacterium]
MGEWRERLAELRGSRGIADKTDETPPSPGSDLWVQLLADAGPLRGTLEAFRAQGCVLQVVGGRVFFGPYDDFEGCVWRDADKWYAAYAVLLAPHELTLMDLLRRLLKHAGPQSPRADTRRRE